jgi:hypothetical protein
MALRDEKVFVTMFVCTGLRKNLTIGDALEPVEICPLQTRVDKGLE